MQLATGQTVTPEARWRVALLLSAAGGFLDAFTWLGHGGVFANAQTGNVVLLGVFAAGGHWRQAVRHVPPVVAFFGGVFVADRLRQLGGREGVARSALLSLAFEIALLSVVAVLPRRFPDLPIVLGIAFIAAVQNSSFGKVEGWSYNSVMTTGNLRRTAEALFSARRDPAVLREACVFASVCLAFALGACAGGVLTPLLGNAAVAAPVLLLLTTWQCCRQRGGSR